MKVTVLLADSGQSDPSGKSHVLGLGWTVTDAPTTQPLAVLVLVTFDRLHDALGSHEIVLRLLDEQGEPVKLSGSDELVLRGDVVVAGTEGGVLDAPANAQLVVNIGPGLPLDPNRRYRWEAVVDGQGEHRADASFVTRGEAAAPV